MEWKGCFFWGRMLGTDGIRESNLIPACKEARHRSSDVQSRY